MVQDVVTISRDCPALLVPVGTQIIIPEGTVLTIAQSLGGSYTVIVNGNMARVDGADADALGLEPEVIEYATPSDGAVNEDDVWDTLRTVYDPEIPVSIVDLGLVYRCDILKDTRGKNLVHIEMTLTAPGCGIGPVLVEEVKQRIARIPNVDDVQVDLVFDPPWDHSMMSDGARLELGMFY